MSATAPVAAPVEVGLSKEKDRAFDIPALDGIRAIAVLMVFVSHAGLDKIVPAGLGVAIFFFLSGFLITTLLRKEHAQHGSISIRNFYIRRVLRIFPPFYLSIAFILLLVRAGILRGTISHNALAAVILYLTNYWYVFFHGITIYPFVVFWSLSVEEHFYMALPLSFVVLNRLRVPYKMQALIFSGCCGLVLAWRCDLVYWMGATNLNRTYMATDTRIDSILFGCVLALWANPVLDRDIRVKWWGVVVGGGALIATLIYRSPEFRETFRYTLQGLACVPIFIACITQWRHKSFSWLNSRPLKFIGMLSYTIYLTHLIFIEIARTWISSNTAIVMLIALPVTILFSYAVHVAVERPFAKLRRRIA